eukprot:gene360-660_t
MTDQSVCSTEEECVICMGSPENIGVLPCQHFFCLNCIMSWSKHENTCPLCKSRFSFIDRREKEKPSVSIESKILSYDNESIKSPNIFPNRIEINSRSQCDDRGIFDPVATAYPQLVRIFVSSLSNFTDNQLQREHSDHFNNFMLQEIVRFANYRRSSIPHSTQETPTSTSNTQTSSSSTSISADSISNSTSNINSNRTQFHQYRNHIDGRVTFTDLSNDITLIELPPVETSSYINNITSNNTRNDSIHNSIPTHYSPSFTSLRRTNSLPPPSSLSSSSSTSSSHNLAISNPDAVNTNTTHKPIIIPKVSLRGRRRTLPSHIHTSLDTNSSTSSSNNMNTNIVSNEGNSSRTAYRSRIPLSNTSVNASSVNALFNMPAQSAPFPMTEYISRNDMVEQLLHNIHHSESTSASTSTSTTFIPRGLKPRPSVISRSSNDDVSSHTSSSTSSSTPSIPFSSSNINGSSTNSSTSTSSYSLPRIESSSVTNSLSYLQSQPQSSSSSSSSLSLSSNTRTLSAINNAIMRNNIDTTIASTGSASSTTARTTTSSSRDERFSIPIELSHAVYSSRRSHQNSTSTSIQTSRDDLTVSVEDTSQRIVGTVRTSRTSSTNNITDESSQKRIRRQ